MMNRDTAKHLAQTLRIVGVSQFANYGYHALTAGDNPIFFLSALVFITFEATGAMIIHIGEK